MALALGLKRMDIFTQAERPIQEEELARLRQLLERRGKREPLQYLLGETEFLGCTLEVNSSVLIPRPETEILADKIIRAIGTGKGKVLWDICTGSGCLGIALKKKLPDLTVVVSDLSVDALATAERNAVRNQVQIECRLGDLFLPFKGEKAHVVVSNPPYVSEEDYETLQPEVKDFEPKSALVSGPSGLEFYARFAKSLPAFLHPGAWVWLEVGPAQVPDLFQEAVWEEKRLEDDWSGSPRFFSLKFKEDF